MFDREITHYNRDDVQSRYIDSIISRLDFMEIKNLLREYLHAEKDSYSYDDLIDEIKSRDPVIYKDVFGISYLNEKEWVLS